MCINPSPFSSGKISNESSPLKMSSRDIDSQGGVLFTVYILNKLEAGSEKIGLYTEGAENQKNCDVYVKDNTRSNFNSNFAVFFVDNSYLSESSKYFPEFDFYFQHPNDGCLHLYFRDAYMMGYTNSFKVDDKSQVSDFILNVVKSVRPH